jgi:photosystem II stability/assembly factor-like uncharacterized protein
MITLPVLRSHRPVALVLAAAALGLAACGPAAPAAPARPASSAAAATPAPAATPSPAAPATTGPGRAPAAGFQVLSMTFVSDQQGWALGSVPCGASRCGALLGTTDGGARWTPLTAPTRTVPGPYNQCPAGAACAGQIRFATPLTGYAYDSSVLITTDGGRTWQPAGGPASSLEAADGTVVRVADPEGCSGAPGQVQVAAAGSTAWRPLPAPYVSLQCPAVLYRQGERLVLIAYGNAAGGVPATAVLARSADGGQTWTAAAPDSCGGGDGYATGVALAPPDVLVLLCQQQGQNANGTDRPGWIRVSADGGAQYGPDEVIPLLPHQPGDIPGYQVAAASAGRILVVEGTDGDGAPGTDVLLTVNGGRSWSPTGYLADRGPVLLVGFEDPLTARVAQGNTVWTTRDGGRTWLSDHFQSAQVSPG